MRFNIKQFNYKRLYIHFCFLALLNIFFSTENIEAKTFSVNDIEISTPFEINFNKNKIIDEGFAQAFNRLVLSILQTQDQKKLSKISLSLIKSMIETFSIKEEKLDGILVLKSAQQLGISKNEITAIKVLRKSIDARKKETFFRN